jgi:pteridine reductase
MSTPRVSDGGTGLDGSRPIALVTGGVKRVGLAIARALARSGCDVVITYRTPGAELEAALASLRGHGAKVEAHRVELSDLASVDVWARELASRLSRLDVLIHSASSYERTPIDQLDEESLLRAFRVNAAAPLLLSRGVAPLLARSTRPGGGSIVAMCDIHAMGEHGLPRRREFSAYAMSKAALAEMVRTLARELAPKVRVNGVAPGVIAWPDSGYESDSAAQESYLRSVPMARAGTPEEGAECARWLALDATYVTGEILRVDGGRNLV